MADLGTLLPKLTYRPQRKLEVFFTGGTARITRDGKLLACTCGEQVQVVDVQTGAVLRSLAGDTEPVTALAVSPDNKTLVVASRSLTVRVYDMTTGEVQRTWRPHKMPVADMAVDASGGYVATASADRTIKIWDLQAGFCTHSLPGHSGVVLRLLFHPKQLQLYSGGDDAEVRVWDLATGKCKALLKSHFSAVTSLALSSDGWTLLSGGRDKVVTAWDLRSCTKLATVPVFESVEGVVSLPLGAPFPAVPAPDDASVLSKKSKPVFFATAGERGKIKIWRSDTAACVYEDVGLATSTINSPTAANSPAQEYTDLVLVPGGATIMATTGDARLMFYKQNEAWTELALARQLVGNVDEVTDVRLVGGSRMEPTHVAVATNCEVIQLFDLSNLSCTASCVGHRDTILTLDAAWLSAKDCQQEGATGVLVSGAKDNEVRVWSMPSGRCLAVGVGHVGSVGAVALARKHAHKFVVSAGADKLLKVWDLAAVLEADAAAVSDPSPAVKRSKKNSGQPQPQPAATGVVQMRATAATAAHDKDINSVAVSPNDQLVATGSQDRTAKVWKLPALTPYLTLRGHKRGVWAVEFSPVDQALLTASGDKTIKMWALAEGGSCLRTFEGHQGSVLRAFFVTAGTQIISAGADGLVKLWSVKSDECVSTFDEHQGKIWAMNTGGPAEQTLVTGGSDACVCVWQDVTQADAAAAEAAEEELMGKEQDLANALADGDFSEAARLAFELRHPGRLLEVVQRAAAVASGKAGPYARALGAASTSVVAGQHTADLLSKLVQHMTDEDLKVALEYCREWNVNSRHCHAAQAMLKALLTHKKPSQLLKVPGVSELVDGLLSYSSRHFSRVDRLLRSTHLLDYSLAVMKVLSPEEEEGAQAQGTVAADPFYEAQDAAVNTAAPMDAAALLAAARANARVVEAEPLSDEPMSDDQGADGDGAEDGVAGTALNGIDTDSAGEGPGPAGGGRGRSGGRLTPALANGHHVSMNGTNHWSGSSESGDEEGANSDSMGDGEGESGSDGDNGSDGAGASDGSLEPEFEMEEAEEGEDSEDEGASSEDDEEDGSEDGFLSSSSDDSDDPGVGPEGSKASGRHATGKAGPVVNGTARAGSGRAGSAATPQRGKQAVARALQTPPAGGGKKVEVTPRLAKSTGKKQRR